MQNSKQQPAAGDVQYAANSHAQIFIRLKKLRA
jgi:hypothetical protein